MPLQTIYRPKTLKEFCGNESLVESLESVLSRKEDVPHAFLFIGASGCGKTTLGRIVARKIGAEGLNLRIYNASNTRGIDTIREVIQQASMAPMSGGNKFYIFEEAHGVTGPGQESLLMLLEEPPKHAYFALTTTEPEKLKITIKRRCFVGEVKPLTKAEMSGLLKRVLKEEGIDEYPEEILKKIAKASEGSPGRALALLDSVVDMDDDEKILEFIEERFYSETGVREVCQALLKRKEWKEISGIVKNLKGEPESIRRGVLGYLEAVLLSRGDARVAEMLEFFTEPVFNSGRPGLTMAIYNAHLV